MSHTPGPWKAVQAGSRVRSGPGGDLYECEDDCIVDQNNVEVLGCSEWLRCKPGDMKLIAAAPDLLEACKQFVDACKFMYRNPGKEDYWFDVPYRLARAAIDKAEGRK